MIICLCHRISDRDIRRAAEAGVRNFEELQDETCIARGCACCEDCARDLFDEARSAGVATVRLVRSAARGGDGRRHAEPLTSSAAG